MNRLRPSGFSSDPSRFRDGSRERWIPLGDDVGDLRPRRHVEDPESRAREPVRDDPGSAFREERSGSA